jgi:crotonobetainyl-CoA:carnitine CoA-transferase CaiB-like acyl-CoA transferase
VSLDLRQPRGRALFAQLARSADVVIENFRSDTLDRLGVGYAWLCEQNPRIVLVSMAGFGQTGPERAMAGYGPLIEQASGLAGLTGYGDGRPQLVEYAYGDPVAAVAAASATLTALIQRRRSGRGQHIDLAQRDVTVAMLGEAFVERCTTGEQPAVRGNRHARMAPHGVYPCAGEDEWVAIAVEDDEQWRGLRAAMGDPAWARATELAGVRGRRERHDELDERMAEWARGLTKREVFARCREHAVAAGPVWNDHELLEDPQLAARGFYEPIAHPAVGEWRTHGWEWRAQGSGRCVRSPAPGFGQHNAEVLGGELGLSDAELAALEAEAVISREPFGVPPLPGADDGSESR